MIDLGDAAVAYAAAGALVFPCVPRGKRPLSEHGKDDATNDVDAVDAWWLRWPEANIAIRPAEGVVVLDVDPRSGGDRTLEQLQAKHGALPRTLTARTGGGGQHYWLGLRGKVRGQLGPGVDAKSNAGYLIAPPSVHESGRSYEWEHEVPIAAAPVWVARLLAPPAAKPRETFERTGGDTTRRAQRLLETVLAAKPGERNRTLFWACSRAIEAGFDLNPLIRAGVHIGLSETEAFRSAQSAARSAAV